MAGSSVKSPNGDGDDDASSVAPSKAAGYTGLEVAGGEDDDDQDNFMARSKVEFIATITI